MKHVNLPIFIPHLGCPHDCVFCNQRTISGKNNFDFTSADNEIRSFLQTTDSSDIEIAFFGGSFTGINRDDMLYLLQIADKYVQNGRVKSIRISTRPDYINDEILSLLKRYGVGTIELGIQCLNDDVLSKCKRGHTVRQALDACHFIKNYGFNLIGQMMIGLPLATPEIELETAVYLCKSNIDAARIYPAVVFHGTELARMTESREYIHLSEDEIIQRTGNVLFEFIKNQIPVIRIGLCASDNLYSTNGIHSGNYHPAIGELAVNYVYYKIIADKLDKIGKSLLNNADIIINCPVGSVSKIIGQKKCNKLKIQKNFNIKNVKVIENKNVLDYNIDITINFNEEEESICI